MNYVEIKKLDVANTNGISCTLFVSGCTHKCKGCFNEVAQDFDYGDKWTIDVENKFIEYCKNQNVNNVAILGGEPFQQSYTEMINLFKRLKNEVNKPIWVWSGYTYSQLLMNQYSKELLHYIDVLIDGKFEEDKKDLTLKHRGSSNQRCIDVQNSLKQQKIVIFEN